MSSEPTHTESYRHAVRKMAGRDSHESHRVATPLELLFDLTFVLAFGQAANKFAHLIADGHFTPALLGFGFSSFAICWAWINFSWFASAYDTDDWVYRLTTMVQMIGVLILAVGLAPMFNSLEHSNTFDNSTMVLGYVVMRVAMIYQWLRAAKQDPPRRQTCLAYVTAIAVAQLGWVALLVLNTSVAVALVAGTFLMLIEMAGPLIAERKQGGTPWHAHHIAERYGLFAIIALGEGVVGTVAALSAVIEVQGWTLESILVSVAGTGLTFGLWWIYNTLPSAQVLHHHRNRSFVWGYGQILIVAAIVAMGAGLHVAAYFIEGKSHISALATVVAVGLPVAIFLAAFYSLYFYLLQSIDRFHIFLLGATGVLTACAFAAAAAGINMAWCLVILMLAPVVTVIGYERKGHKHQAQALAD